MTVSPAHRALRQLTGGNRSTAAEPLVPEHYPVARRVLAGLLGVLLAEPSRKRDPIASEARDFATVVAGGTSGRSHWELGLALHEADLVNAEFFARVIISARGFAHQLARDIAVHLERADWRSSLAADLDRVLVFAQDLAGAGILAANYGPWGLDYSLRLASDVAVAHASAEELANSLNNYQISSSDLADARVQGREVTRALTGIRSYVYNRIPGSGDQGKMTTALDRLEDAHVLANSLASVLGSDTIDLYAITSAGTAAGTLLSAFDAVFTIACTFVEQDLGYLVNSLGDIAVDASGADLTSVTINDRDALAGIIWSDQTRWRPSVEVWVREHSDPIGRRRHKVSGRSERESADLVRV